MKRANGIALVAALMVTGLQAAPATAAEPDAAPTAEEGPAAEMRKSNRLRAEHAQAEAAAQAAEAVVSATKLDLDIRLIGPTSIAGDLD